MNYRIRAETAALNAGIIPYLEALFRKIGASLHGRGVKAPIMVVKSDGSLTSIEVARERPIETILSGPAASVAGARYLTRETDVLVIDMGGTTSDTAVIKDGTVKTCPQGAVVGCWETHVKALDMRTLGLGGDSLIALERGAPVHQFLPEACRKLYTHAVIPQDADVANAVGAITSTVCVRKQVNIAVNDAGIFHVKGLVDSPTFQSLESAQEYAVQELKSIVSKMARRAGTDQRKIEIIGNDKLGSVADGSSVFLERIIEARVSGRPAIDRLKSSE